MDKVKYPNYTGYEPCSQLGLEFFYYEEREVQPGKSKKGKSTYIDIDAAKRACSMCPMIQECLTWALHRERYGIWAGTTERERIAMRTRLGIRVEEPHLIK